jgi:hypothetical protein
MKKTVSIVLLAPALSAGAQNAVSIGEYTAEIGEEIRGRHYE